jgi:lipoprotein-releasing system ATP-binding protein
MATTCLPLWKTRQALGAAAGSGKGSLGKSAPTESSKPESASDRTVLEAKGLGKSFMSGLEELVILSSLDLRVERGRSIAILGASGSGKSTLLYILGGLDRPTSGGVYSRGESIFNLSEPELAHWRMKEIGFVFQYHHLLPEFTALENVAMPLMISGVKAEEAASRAEPILARVGLSLRLKHRPGILSGGEQQRVALARAIIMEPTILLADEPTGNLDGKNAEMVNKLILELVHEKSLSAVVVTHNAELSKLMDTRLTLSNGKLSPMEG